MKVSKVVVTAMFIALLSVLVHNNVSAQNNAVLPVEVKHSGDDIIGARLVYKIKELIRRSSSMQMEAASGNRFIISIITIDHDKNDPGHLSAYSAAYLYERDEDTFELYLSGAVGFCGSQRIDEAAESIVAGMDVQMEAFRRASANLQPHEPQPQK